MSVGLNYHLPNYPEHLVFFTDPYCAGVSNKHCSLTFFHFVIALEMSNLAYFMKIFTPWNSENALIQSHYSIRWWHTQYMEVDEEIIKYPGQMDLVA